MTTIYFELDGKPVPSRECFWFCIAPCGCYSGVMSTDVGPIVATVEQAWKEYFRPAPVRELHRKQGFKIVLGPRDDIDKIKHECQHVPKWGYEKTPVPDGYRWAKGYKGRLIHLVQGTPDKSYQISSYADKISALCGADGHFWDAFPGLHSDYVECGKCAKEAKAGDGKD